MHVLLAFCVASMTIALSLFFPGPLPVHAASLTVNTLADNTTNGDGFCTLREAMTAAENNANYNDCASSGYGADTIDFSVNGMIVLTTWLPYITDTLTIYGPGASLLTMSGNNTVNVMSVLGGGILHLSDVTIAHGGNSNYGGGIYNSGTLNITNTTFYSNTASLYGGGIMNGGGKLIVTNSTFYSNVAGYGGGIYSNGPLTVTNSAFYSNTASVSAGGGIFNQSFNIAIITNTTFYSNTATTVGGGLYNEGTLTVTNSTIAYNAAALNAGGVRSSGGTVTLRNTIVAYNTAPLYDNCYSTTGFINGGNNLQFGGAIASSCGVGIPIADPKLGPLANNGGSTQTMALLPGSPAIDAGNDALCPATDQRGAHRPIGPHCDVGAYEDYLQIYLPLILK
jgi:CSLREA domain-containing protein